MPARPAASSPCCGERPIHDAERSAAGSSRSIRLPAMAVRLRAALPYAVIALFGAALAYFSLFSQFAPHDDSGHLSVSLTEFIAGRNLYEDLYSQYGPLYFEMFGGLFSLPGIELTTDSVRLLTMVLWVVCG